MSDERFVVREATGPAWDWLPDWLVVDLERKVRVGAYDDEQSAITDAALRNEAGAMSTSDGLGA